MYKGKSKVTSTFRSTTVLNNARSTTLILFFDIVSFFSSALCLATHKLSHSFQERGFQLILKSLLQDVREDLVWGESTTSQRFLERSKGMKVWESEIWAVERVFQISKSICWWGPRCVEPCATGCCCLTTKLSSKVDVAVCNEFLFSASLPLNHCNSCYWW